MMKYSGWHRFGVVFRYVDVPCETLCLIVYHMDVRLGWTIMKALELNIVGQNLLSGQSTQNFIPSSPSPRKIERGVYGKLYGDFWNHNISQ